MANQTTGNPMVLDTAETIWTGQNKSVRLIQWINDAGDINNTNADLVFTINTTEITLKIDKHDTDASVDENDVIAYQAGPFNPGIGVTNLVLTTIDAGVLHVWLS
jgi:hypothetical protein